MGQMDHPEGLEGSAQNVTRKGLFHEGHSFALICVLNCTGVVGPPKVTLISRSDQYKDAT